MKQLPKAIRDLQGDLWVPAETANLLEAILRDATIPAASAPALTELNRLLGFSAERKLPGVRDQLEMPDPERERRANNLLRLSAI